MDERSAASRPRRSAWWWLPLLGALIALLALTQWSDTTAAMWTGGTIVVLTGFAIARWTVVLLREMLCGSTRFNDLRRGLPRMSPTLVMSTTISRMGPSPCNWSVKMPSYFRPLARTAVIAIASANWPATAGG